MNRLFRNVLLGAVLTAATLSLWPAPAYADADDYWDQHWRWYDRTYRPYYHRRYYYVAPPVYSNSAGPPNYYNNYQAPGTPYYGGAYYGPTYYPSNGVIVGPLRFGWW